MVFDARSALGNTIVKMPSELTLWYLLHSIYQYINTNKKCPRRNRSGPKKYSLPASGLPAGRSTIFNLKRNLRRGKIEFPPIALLHIFLDKKLQCNTPAMAHRYIVHLIALPRMFPRGVRRCVLYYKCRLSRRRLNNKTIVVDSMRAHMYL